MSEWTSVLAGTACPRCGVDLSPWRLELRDALDWSDEEERENGMRAHAQVAHFHEAHRVCPAVGDLVTYTHAWRGFLNTTATVYEVRSVTENADFHDFARRMGDPDIEPLYTTRYGLVSPGRRSDYCLPNMGLPDDPIYFTIVTEAPAVQTNLFDLLDWEEDLV